MEPKIPVFLIMRDLVSWPREMCAHIVRLGGTPILVDNASSYPPLLAWYEDCGFEVIRLQENLLQLSPWISGAVAAGAAQAPDGFYCVSDPDLDISGCPDDTLTHLKNLYMRYGDLVKVGLSLEVLDYPQDSPVCSLARGWETPFWTNKRDWQCYSSPVDTTFALYNIRRDLQVHSPRFTTAAIRADRPFTARHLPFYLTPDNFTIEDWYYLKHANPRSTMARYLQGLVEHFEQTHPKEVQKHAKS